MQGIRFRHEIEWYEYYYQDTLKMVGICHKHLEPCCILYYSKDKILERIQLNKWNPFLLPIYQEALTHFPKEV